MRLNLTTPIFRSRPLLLRSFIFLFIQGFIVATLSSGIMAGISQITDNPGSAVQLLANNLPKASIFFLTLIVTSGLSGAAGGVLQIAKLAIYYIKVVLLGGSPRALWKIRYTMPNASWGTTYPAQLLLVVIAIAYSTIAPLVAGFATLTFALYYVSRPKDVEQDNALTSPTAVHVQVLLHLDLRPAICLRDWWSAFQDCFEPDLRWNLHPAAVPVRA